MTDVVQPGSLEADLIPVYIMGKRYMVPPTLTIMKAMEWAGYTLIRGVGCRTVVQPDMYLAQIPFFPAQRATYDITQLEPTAVTLFSTYPEVLRCLGCGACTKACPQDIDVRTYMAAGMRGDVATMADLSFDCIMCGLCAARCPAEEAQYNIAILARRLYGRYLAPRSEHLRERLEEIEAGTFDADLEELKGLDEEELMVRYKARDIEPK
jgi:ferredoxin